MISTVKVGDVLWARFNLYRTEGELENMLKVTIINFRGEKVDEFGILLPRPTTAPGE
ncbi:MAG: hypothetical protein QXE51_03915 [Nitrososphaeria archaeon]